MKSSYYSSRKIDATGATYRLIIGQRSNGKTFDCCRKIIDTYIDDGIPSAYIRRMDEMIKPSNIQNLFRPHYFDLQKDGTVKNYIDEKTEHKYNSVTYWRRAWYLCRVDTDDAGRTVKTAQDKDPFCRAYSINAAETTKGQDAGEIKYICFDEFITRQFYLANEFVKFQNLLSSLIRDRDGVIIYMLANTVSKHCPYFRDMGLFRIQQQQQGTIDLYTMGDSKTKIAVEYCSPTKATTKVSKYFAFDNPQLKMITTGTWEIALYRHAPEQLSQHPIILTFFVIYDGRTIQGDIYQYKDAPLIFWHPKTTEIKDPEHTIIYKEDQEDSNPLHQIYYMAGQTKAQKVIAALIRQQKTFYADNETGENVKAWLRFTSKAVI